MQVAEPASPGQGWMQRLEVLACAGTPPALGRMPRIGLHASTWHAHRPPRLSLLQGGVHLGRGTQWGQVIAACSPGAGCFLHLGGSQLCSACCFYFLC